MSIFALIHVENRKQRMNPNVKIWMEQVGESNETAFRRLFEHYYQKLFHLALFFLHSKEFAEECVSDVFVILWRKRELFREVDDVEKYLYTTVKNQALHYIRRDKTLDNEYLELYEVEAIEEEDNPEKALLHHEQVELIQAAIYSLPEKCREVFRLVMQGDLKHREIAELLGISEKTVEAHVASAYKRVAEYVNREYNRPGKQIHLFLLFF